MNAFGKRDSVGHFNSRSLPIVNDLCQLNVADGSRGCCCKPVEFRRCVEGERDVRGIQPDLAGVQRFDHGIEGLPFEADAQSVVVEAEQCCFQEVFDAGGNKGVLAFGLFAVNVIGVRVGIEGAAQRESSGAVLDG